jgi:hypothetical protein
VPHPDATVRRKIESGLSRIFADEERHIVGTGMLINRAYPSDAFMPTHLRCAFERYVTFIAEAVH